MLVSLSLQAQRIALVSGKPSFLKGQSTIDVEFDYDECASVNLSMNKITSTKKIAEYNEKEAGSGDTWVKAWIDDRETRFEPKFLELINKYLEKPGIMSTPKLTTQSTPCW